MKNRVILVAAVLVVLTVAAYPIGRLIETRLSAFADTLPLSAVRIANDQYQVPASYGVFAFGQVTNMTATILVHGDVQVQFFSDCTVSVTIGGYGVLLWVRLIVDGMPAGVPADPAYPGVHPLCTLTAGGYVVSEAYHSTVWSVSGLTVGPHTFAIQATLVGFTSGVLTGPGPGTNGVLGPRTMIAGPSQ